MGEKNETEGKVNKIERGGEEGCNYQHYPPYILLQLPLILLHLHLNGNHIYTVYRVPYVIYRIPYAWQF